MGGELLSIKDTEKSLKRKQIQTEKLLVDDEDIEKNDMIIDGEDNLNAESKSKKSKIVAT